MIGPLLQATPDLTHAEALEAVRAAGVSVSYRVHYRIWRDYLTKRGLNDPEIVSARRRRANAMVRQREKKGVEPISPGGIARRRAKAAKTQQLREAA